MHGNITAVTVQFNKIVSNEVKDNEVLLEPSYGKKTNELFGGANSILFTVGFYTCHGSNQRQVVTHQAFHLPFQPPCPTPKILALICNITTFGPLWSPDHFCCFCSCLCDLARIITLHSYFFSPLLLSHFGLASGQVGSSWQIWYLDPDSAGKGREQRGVFLSLTWRMAPNRLLPLSQFLPFDLFQQDYEDNITPILQMRTLRRRYHRY